MQEIVALAVALQCNNSFWCA